MGYSIAQEDLTEKWWLIGTLGLGYMATIPFKNNCPALDDCTSIENTRTHFRIIRNTWRHIFVLNYLHIICLFSPLSHVSFVSSSRSTLHLHAAINPSTFQSLYWNSTKEKTRSGSKPQATTNLCTLPSPPKKRRFVVKPVSFRRVAPLHESQLEKPPGIRCAAQHFGSGKRCLKAQIGDKSSPEMSPTRRRWGLEGKGKVVGK